MGNPPTIRKNTCKNACKLILLLTSIVIPTNAFPNAHNQKYFDVRKTSWGMNPKDVIALEGRKPYDKHYKGGSLNYYEYRSDSTGAWWLYVFVQNRLVEIHYNTRWNMSVAQQEYDKVRKLITDGHGPPDTTRTTIHGVAATVHEWVGDQTFIRIQMIKPSKGVGSAGHAAYFYEIEHWHKKQGLKAQKEKIWKQKKKAQLERERKILSSAPVRKWVEIAAKNKNPYDHMRELYLDFILPSEDKVEAFMMSEKFIKRALRMKDAGFLVDTVDLPWFNYSYVKEQRPKIEKATGKSHRVYYVRYDFHVNNVYGTKTLLNLYAYLRTPDNTTWDCYKITIENPSLPVFKSTIVSIKTDEGKEKFTSIPTPSLLRQRLDTYLKQQKEKGQG